MGVGNGSAEHKPHPTPLPSRREVQTQRLLGGHHRGTYEEGWKLIYTDGTGRSEEAAAAIVVKNRDVTEKTTSSRYIGNCPTASDQERAAVSLASDVAGGLNFILPDSQQTARQLSSLT